MKNFILIAVSIVQLCCYGALQAELERFLLITGCARSGTTYISKVMQKCGLDIQHEQIGNDGISTWTMAVPSDRTPWGPPLNNIHFTHIFHQVRHPLKTIASVYTNEYPESWEFIMRHIPEIHKEDPLLVKSAKYWYYWNLRAEELAEWTYCVENIENIWDEYQERLGVSLSFAAMRQIPKDTNSRNKLHWRVTWKDLKRELDKDLYQKIRALAKRYGYSD